MYTIIPFYTLLIINYLMYSPGKATISFHNVHGFVWQSNMHYGLIQTQSFLHTRIKPLITTSYYIGPEILYIIMRHLLRVRQLPTSVNL